MMTKGRPGLFLDLDGTLADSLGVMREIYERFLAEFGRAGSPEEFDRLNGPSLSDVLEILKRDHYLTPSADELCESIKDFFVKPMLMCPRTKGHANLLGWPLMKDG